MSSTSSFTIDTPKTKIKGAKVVAGLQLPSTVSALCVANDCCRDKSKAYATGLILKQDSPATRAKYVLATRLQVIDSTLIREAASILRHSHG